MIRLNRIYAPELRGKERPSGIESRDYLRSLILDKEVFIETIKDKKGKYGRYLGEIWLEGLNNKFTNINDKIVKDGFVIYKKY
jgi:micrococcal nuclease